MADFAYSVNGHPSGSGSGGGATDPSRPGTAPHSHSHSHSLSHSLSPAGLSNPPGQGRLDLAGSGGDGRASGSDTSSTQGNPSPSMLGLNIAMADPSNDNSPPANLASNPTAPSVLDSYSHPTDRPIGYPQQQQQQHYSQHHHHQHPPGSAGGHSNLWGYSVPSPPQTARPSSSASPAFPHHPQTPASAGGLAHSHPAAAAAAQYGHHYSYPPPSASSTGHHAIPGYPPQGYNLSNTRPLTAPSGITAQPGYYHGTAYGGMFSPATYSGAGFSHPINHHRQQHQQQQQQAGQDPRIPPGSANGPSSGMGIEDGASQRHHHRAYPAGVQDAGHASGPPAAHSFHPLLHHQSPPPPGSQAGPSAPHDAAHWNHQQQNGMPRRSFDGDEEAYRPGTSGTARPDTAVSMYSNYSSHSAAAPYPPPHPHHYAPAPGHGHPMGHAEFYNTGGPHQPGEHPLGPPFHPYASALAQYPHAPHHQHPHQHPHGQPMPHPGPGGAGKGYSFVPLPSQPKKRPRRRFEEIERLYDCGYPGCNKAYGTLNHLNAHVSMQKHGPKRLPAEFKEIRKAWRQRKKESEAGHSHSGEKKGRPGTSGSAGSSAGSVAGGPHQPHKPGGPHLPSLSSSVIKQQQQHQHQQQGDATIGAGQSGAASSAAINMPAHSAGVTPPSSGSLPATPMFGGLQSFHGYYTSPGSYARPNTAPSHMVNQGFGSSSSLYPSHYPSSASSGPVPSPGGALAGTSPMLPAGFPSAAYLGNKRGSITSIPPSFAAIEEDPQGEHVAQLDNLPSASAGQDSFGYSDSNGLLGSSAHADGMHSPNRPSTASSPFRYSANNAAARNGHNHIPPFATQDELDDEPARAGMQPPQPSFEDPNERRANTSDGFAGLAALQDAAGGWSPDWKSLSQRYTQEIQH